MEDQRRCSRSKAARRSLRSLLTLASDYLKYLFMNRRRLLGRVASRTLAVLSYHGKSSSKHLPPYWTPRLSMEHEFSCRDSPSPAFLAAKRLQSRLKRGAAVSSFFCGGRRASYGSPPPSPAMEERKDDVIEEEEEEEEEEEYGADGCACCELEHDVDCRAEEFINMFYAQLRAQSFPAVLQ